MRQVALKNGDYIKLNQGPFLFEDGSLRPMTEEEKAAIALNNYKKIEGSSNVDFVDYIDDAKTLIVGFHGGNSYEYANCPKDKYFDLIAAKSPGSYFSTEIRNKFQSKKRGA